MRIRLQNFVSIQPRTSLEKSDVSWPTSSSSARRFWSASVASRAPSWPRACAAARRTFSALKILQFFSNFSQKLAFAVTLHILQNPKKSFLIFLTKRCEICSISKYVMKLCKFALDIDGCKGFWRCFKNIKIKYFPSFLKIYKILGGRKIFWVSSKNQGPGFGQVWTKFQLKNMFSLKK